MTIEILFSEDGGGRCVYSDRAASLMPEIGPVRIARASHVEPTADAKWEADLRPCDGPLLGPFETRAEALAAELAWLIENDVPLPNKLRRG